MPYRTYSRFGLFSRLLTVLRFQDDVIGMLCLFSSLETLSLRPLKWLHFGQKKPWCRNVRQDGAAPVDIAEARILWYTSRIAQRVPSLKAFYIHEESEQFSGEGHWCLRGWLGVSSAGGGRDVGKLR